MKNYFDGLSEEEAAARLKDQGPNVLRPPKKCKFLRLFSNQFKSPLVLLLIGAAGLSFLLGDTSNSLIIGAIVIFSAALGFIQEAGAVNSLEKLLQMVSAKATVMRGGKEVEIGLAEVVLDDVLVLRVGDIIAADCTVQECTQMHIDESTLTGESFSVPKQKGDLLLMGTVVASGMGRAIVTATGRNTEYGRIAESARFQPPATAFEIGVRKFGNFLVAVTAILVSFIFAFNVLLHRPFLESFLFSLALAVGLTPQLLPAIITVNLAHGALRMAKKKVVIKRLASIENFGQMNILCTDKTGTITVGKIELDRAVGSEKTLPFAALNAHFQSSYQNPMDLAILEKAAPHFKGWEKRGEIPYDFQRKQMSVMLEKEGRAVLITKGAASQIIERCSRIEVNGKVEILKDKGALEAQFEEQNALGFKALGVAYGEEDKEEDLIFLGFLYFFDPLKPDIAQVVAELKRKGIKLKIITGDHHSVALYAAKAIGLFHEHLVTGSEMEKNGNLHKMVREKNVFAEILPHQKEQIVRALRAAGDTVGYLGDGVNDINALRAADVGIAVDSGAESAKEAADIVLLQKDLSVLREGVEEGRLTFANTIKYVYMATSANFGNMFSMAGASLFLNFLPMLPKQILLTNLLTDLPEMAISTDQVDPEGLRGPAKWDLSFIGRFMIVFGLISSVFDYATFGVLYFVLKADPAQFQTGWFVESVASAALVVLAIRTRKVFFLSRPSIFLTLGVVGVIGIVFFIPGTNFGSAFGFVSLPAYFYGAVAAIITSYLLFVEIAKRIFFRRY